LNARGDRLREQLNEVLACMPMQFTGQGSVMNLHPTGRPILRPTDIPTDRNSLRDLFFFHLLEGGIYSARRGLFALSLPLTEHEMNRLVNATQAFVERYGGMLTGD
jgi:glutamate-1-semialdehyde 2,1-aminomutase